MKPVKLNSAMLNNDSRCDETLSVIGLNFRLQVHV